jgi:hypothetical protein
MHMMAWDSRALAAEARRILQSVDELPSTSIHDMLYTPDAGEPTLLSAAVRLYSEDRVPLNLVLQLLGRLDAASARAILSTTNGGWTVLMDACRMIPQEDELVQVLLAAGAGATVNASNGDGLTALMIASRHGLTSATRLLVQHQADIDQLDAYGRSALHHACEMVATGPAAVLVGADATVHQRTLRCCTTSAARIVGVCALCLLIVCLGVVWLAQRVHCLHPFCPWPLAPPIKKARRRRRGAHEASAPQPLSPSARPLLVHHLYRRPEMQAICLICACAAAIVRALLYQQVVVHRALETHVQQMPTIHWEFFALAQVSPRCPCLPLPRCTPRCVLIGTLASAGRCGSGRCGHLPQPQQRDHVTAALVATRRRTCGRGARYFIRRRHSALWNLCPPDALIRGTLCASVKGECRPRQ